VTRSGPAFLEQLLFPPCCYLCSANLQREAKGHLRYICRHCLADCPLIWLCPGLSLPSQINPDRHGSSVLASDTAAALFSVFFLRRRDPGLILGLKFGGRLGERPPLGSLMAAVLAEELKRSHLRPTAVVPMPLSHNRRLRRGYNQSELLADFLAAELGLEVLPLVIRSRETARQSELKTLAERKSNVKDAFALAPDVTEQALRDRQFILVDDVLTSGIYHADLSEVLQAAERG